MGEVPLYKSLSSPSRSSAHPSVFSCFIPQLHVPSYEPLRLYAYHYQSNGVYTEQLLTLTHNPCIAPTDKQRARLLEER